MSQSLYVQGSLFEDDYLIRTLGALAHSADVALTELVANAWDAGASCVDITIPSERGERLIIQDDGIGLSKEEFHNRWMKLGYNRIKHQGNKVIFPKGRTGTRMAYGRNGIGRHGLLCFNNEYVVITESTKNKATFIISTLNESQPFVLKSETEVPSNGHGTRLEVVADRNLPNPDRILEVLSARFLHDPQFVVIINGKSVPLEEHSGLINSTDIKVDSVSLKLHFIDSQKAARTTIYQGIAFWQGGRLVGEPTWILGSEAVIDGRTRFAKRYTVVVKTDDLAEYILEDWTGFKKSDMMEKIYTSVAEYVNDMFRQLAKENLEETKQQVKREFGDHVKDLSPLGQYEVDEAIEVITLNHPTARPEVVSLAIEAVINLEKTRTGKELLKKLSVLSEEDIAGLNKLLDQWTIKDALCVLDEIDGRISVIEAIRKLSSDKDIDELQILHPLITEARWLFGPEYDSPEYVSNKQLKTAVKDIFKIDLDSDDHKNRRRPDLLIKNEATWSVTGTESFDNDSSLSTLNKILLIELKRGGFKLTRGERNQAQGYVEDFINCGSIIGNPYIYAFVVGQEYGEKIQPIATVQNINKVEQGKVCITTYSQLVDTAEKRLFKLRDKLGERYEDISGMDLYRKTIQPKLGL